MSFSVQPDFHANFVGCDGRYFVRNRKRFFPIGINYLPSYLCGNYFADYRTEHIRADLDHISDIGLNCLRIPVFWAGYEPEKGQYSDEFLTVFRGFVNECGSRDLLVMPVFLIGTWTGMYNAPYWMPPGMYEGEMLELEARHIASFAKHFADDQSILCWDLSDEPYYLEGLPITTRRTALGAPPSPRNVAIRWVSRLVTALREVDPNHLITLGFDKHPVFMDNCFALEEIAEHLDVMSYCTYSSVVNRTEIEIAAYGAFQTRFFAAGKPPFLHEGPGASSSSASDSLLADRFRVWLYTSLANGAIGVLPWNYTDYEEDIHAQYPLENQPLEPNFGICRADRSLKPQGEEFLRFAADVRRLPLDELELDPFCSALIYPHAYYEHAGELHDRFWRHFTLAKGANIRLDLIREDRLPDDVKLLIAPGLKLRQSTWAKLRDFVAGGGHLLGIFDDLDFLNPIFAEFFGVEIEGCRAGSLEATFTRPWGDLLSGLSWGFSGSASRLLVRAAGTDVIASFRDGFPFLLSRSFGRGRVSLATVPFPMLVDLNDPRGTSTTVGLRILQGARDLTGYRPPVDTDIPWVETALLRGQAGDDWVILANYDRVPVEGEVHIRGEYSAAYAIQGVPLEGTGAERQLRIPLLLGPHGAVVWRLSRE